MELGKFSALEVIVMFLSRLLFYLTFKKEKYKPSEIVASLFKHNPIYWAKKFTKKFRDNNFVYLK